MGSKKNKSVTADLEKLKDDMSRECKSIVTFSNLYMSKVYPPSIKKVIYLVKEDYINESYVDKEEMLKTLNTFLLNDHIDKYLLTDNTKLDYTPDIYVFQAVRLYITFCYQLERGVVDIKSMLVLVERLKAYIDKVKNKDKVNEAPTVIKKNHNQLEGPVTPFNEKGAVFVL